MEVFDDMDNQSCDTLLEQLYDMQPQEVEEWQKDEPDSFKHIMSFLFFFYVLDEEEDDLSEELSWQFDTYLPDEYRFIQDVSILFWRQLYRNFPEQFPLLLTSNDEDEQTVPIMNMVWGFAMGVPSLIHYDEIYTQSPHVPEFIKNEVVSYTDESLLHRVGFWHILEIARQHPAWALERVKLLGKTHRVRNRHYGDCPINIVFSVESAAEPEPKLFEVSDLLERWHLAGVLIACRTIFSSQEYLDACKLLVSTSCLRRLALTIEKVRIEDMTFHAQTQICRLGEKRKAEDELQDKVGSMKRDLFIEMLEARVAYPAGYIKEVFTALERGLDIPQPPPYATPL